MTEMNEDGAVERLWAQGTCRECERQVSLTPTGDIRAHGPYGSRCPGTGKKPREHVGDATERLEAQGTCRGCGRLIRLSPLGDIRTHGPDVNRCPGSGKKPRESVSDVTVLRRGQLQVHVCTSLDDEDAAKWANTHGEGGWELVGEPSPFAPVPCCVHRAFRRHLTFERSQIKEL